MYESLGNGSLNARKNAQPPKKKRFYAHKIDLARIIIETLIPGSPVLHNMIALGVEVAKRVGYPNPTSCIPAVSKIFKTLAAAGIVETKKPDVNLSDRSTSPQLRRKPDHGELERLFARKWHTMSTSTVTTSNYETTESKLHTHHADILFYEEFRKSDSFPLILTRSPLMRDLETYLRRVCAYQKSEFLLLGETGVGKQLFARAVHEMKRSGKPFVEVNSAGIPSELVENELFGHKKGAFTDAHGEYHGKFLLANGGTLFLDEIGDMSTVAQAKILKAMEEKAFTPIGSTTSIRVDIQIVAATNCDVSRKIRDGKLREDLLYRLGVHVRIPPLRERADDIEPLVEHFLREYAEENRIPQISEDTWTALRAHPWPGNVRELMRACQTAVYSGKKVVGISDFFQLRDVSLPLVKVSSPRSEIPSLLIEQSETLPTYEDVEKQYIIAILSRTKGNVSKAARIAKITRHTIHNYLKKYNLSHSSFES